MKSPCIALLFAAPLFAQGDAAPHPTLDSLGVRFAPKVAENALQPGLRIVSVTERSPAAVAGLAAGDVLIRFDGTIVADANAVAALAGELDDDDHVELVWFRRGEHGWTELSGELRLGVDGERVVRETLGLDFAVIESKIRRRIISTDSPWGFKIARVDDGSLADDLGLKRGNILMQWDGRPVRQVDELAQWLRDAKPGAVIKIEVARKKKKKKKTPGILSRDPWETVELELTIPGERR